MTLINDIREEIINLDQSNKKLRTFGLAVGIVFLLLMLLLTFKHYFLAARPLLGIMGLLLMIIGAFRPYILKSIYKVWMGSAFILSWLVSRFLLMLLFFVIVTPIGFTARLLGKEFLDLKTDKVKDSYWVKRDTSRKVNYEKMF